MKRGLTLFVQSCLIHVRETENSSNATRAKSFACGFKKKPIFVSGPFLVGRDIRQRTSAEGDNSLGATCEYHKICL